MAKEKAPAAKKEAKGKKTTAKKAAPKKKDAAEKKAGTGRGRGGAPNHPQEGVIKMLAESNPKREGSKAHARFKLYKDGMTVGQFIAKGGTRGDINWDVKHGHIKVEAPKKLAA